MKLETKLKIVSKSNNKEKIETIFNEIYYEYSKLVYFIISGYIKNPLDIEELVDDVFLNFYKKIPTNTFSNIKYYLTTSAKNTSINFVKSKSHHNYIFDETCIFSCIDKNLSNDLFEDYIIDMKQYLTNQEIEIILQHAVYDETFKSLACKFKTKTSTIASKYTRAIRKFKQHKKEENKNV